MATTPPTKPSAPLVPEPGPLGPTTRGKRIDSIDTLRGLALLGIFVMNIPTFALSEAAFFNPPVAGGFEGLDFATWLVSHLFFELKMMAIFSMLFGAGVALMAERAAEAGRGAGVHYRRMGWLLLIGMAHAYLIWIGDILVGYAIIGMLVYPLRRLPAIWLAIIACALLPVAMVLSGVQQAMFEFLRSSNQPDVMETWKDVGTMFYPTEASLEEERQGALGGFYHRVTAHAEGVIFMQTYVLAAFMLWRVGGLMLLGMALHKWGVFKAERSTRFYLAMLLVGGLLGGGIVGTGVGLNFRGNFDPVAYFGVMGWFNYAGSIGVALAWVALIMLLCKSGALGWLRHALASVGRMALTNYLMQSIIAAFIFYGWGLGYFGSLSRSEFAPIVLGVWAFQLVVSPLWLSRFRFGPMEWVWRSLTYWKITPMRKSAERGTVGE